MNDLIIVGAGPAGLYAAYLAGLRQLKTIVLEALPQVGGQLSAFYPDKPIYDIPGFASIEAQAFIDQLQHQFNRFSSTIPIETNARVVAIKDVEGGYDVVTSTKTYQTRYVLFTTGAGSLTPRRLPQLPTHPRVHYTVQSIHDYVDQRLLILGGGDTALDWTTQLQSKTHHLTLSHRRDEFRGLDSSLDALASHVTVRIPYIIQQVSPQEDKLLVTFEHTQTKESIHDTYDHLFVAYGFEADTAQWENLPLERKQQKLAVNTMMETSLNGVYGAGHAVMYPGKTNTIATAFGEANTAVDAITHRLRPGKAIPFSSFLPIK